MALDELLDEHEQGEKVRSWLRENAFALISGLVLGLGIIGGWQWWQKSAHAKRIALGDAYQAVVDDLTSGNLDKAQAASANLREGAYGELIALGLAKAQIDAGKPEDAIATLRAVKSSDPGLASVVRQRLARLLIDADKADEALALLAGADDPVSSETRGDAQHALGKPELARDEYAAALRQLDVASPQRQLVEFKLADVGGQPDSVEAGS